jgi:hypothetical protein
MASGLRARTTTKGYRGRVAEGKRNSAKPPEGKQKRQFAAITITRPYRKTEGPIRIVARRPSGVQIVQGAELSCLNNSATTYIGLSGSILTVYDHTAHSAFGLTLAGGPQEAAIQGASGVDHRRSATEPGARSSNRRSRKRERRTATLPGRRTKSSGDYPVQADTLELACRFIKNRAGCLVRVCGRIRQMTR